MKITDAKLIETKTGKEYLKVTLDDGRNVSVWAGDKTDFTTFEIGKEFPADHEIVQKDKYFNARPIVKNTEKKAQWQTRPSQQKQIVEAQDRKAQNVSQAQDRNEKMWAKTNASTLVANHPAYKELQTPQDVEDAVSQLASKILNDELQPF